MTEEPIKLSADDNMIQVDKPPEQGKATWVDMRQPPYGEMPLQMIERAAANPDIDVAKFERLMAMQERILDREAEQAFARDMVAAQAEITRVVADADNSQTDSKYASYPKLDAMVRPIASKYGFAMTFGTEPGAPDRVVVICDVLHKGGHAKHYRIDMPADGKGPKGGDVMTRTHATGAGMMYGRRYLLLAIWNIPVGDDDGNKADSRVQYISELQALELDALINDNELDRASFMAWLAERGTRALADIKLTDLGLMKNTLQKAIKAKAKR